MKFPFRMEFQTGGTDKTLPPFLFQFPALTTDNAD